MSKYKVTYHNDNQESKVSKEITLYDCKGPQDARTIFGFKFKQPRYRNCNFVITKVEKV